MKTMFKRVFCILMIFVLTFGLIACGSSTPEQTEPPTEIASVAPTAPATEIDSVPPTKPSLQTHADGSWHLLHRYVKDRRFGLAQYSLDEIRSMKDYSATELQAAISTVPDMIQYIIANNFGAEPLLEGDLLISYDGHEWSLNKSPQGTLLSQSKSCGSVANLVRFVLEDDYDEEGYIHLKDFFSSSCMTGGHVFNYFRQDNIYLLIDFTQIIHYNLTDNWYWKDWYWCVSELEDIVPKLLTKSVDPSQEQYTRWAIYVERDVHHDHAPSACINPSMGKFTFFYDSSFSDEIEFLHLDTEWLTGPGKTWVYYDQPFKDGGITSSMVPSELVDSADMKYYRDPITPNDTPSDDGT